MHKRCVHFAESLRGAVKKWASQSIFYYIHKPSTTLNQICICKGTLIEAIKFLCKTMGFSSSYLVCAKHITLYVNVPVKWVSTGANMSPLFFSSRSCVTDSKISIWFDWSNPINYNCSLKRLHNSSEKPGVSSQDHLLSLTLLKEKRKHWLAQAFIETPISTHKHKDTKKQRDSHKKREKETNTRRHARE